MSKKNIIATLLAIVALSASAQCRYCYTYEELLDDQWQLLDTVYCKGHSKNRQVWVGGNDYTLTTGDKTIDNILEKEAFAVMLNDTLYVNCRNLRYEKAGFGKGYTQAKRIGQHSLIFVNGFINGDAPAEAGMFAVIGGTFGGAIGGAMAGGIAGGVSTKSKQQVCYIISEGADHKGLIKIHLLDDNFMNQIVSVREDLHDEYFAEKNASKRIRATHVIPILEKTGLFEQSEQTNTEN